MPVEAQPGDIVQVLHQYDLEGQKCENVWYFRAQALDPDILANLLAAIATCLIPILVPKLSTSYTFERLRAKVVSPAVGPEVDYYAGVGVATAGVAAGDGLPSHDSAIVSLYTERGGRSGRGRIYIGGVPEGDTIKSYINTEAPLWGAILAFLVCMLATFKPHDVPAAGDYDWGVMSRKLGGLKPPFLPAGYAMITRAEPRRELATTRSRKIGHGR